MALRRAAARLYGVADEDRVVIAAGSQTLIQLLPGLWPKSRVAVIGPTYGEHMIRWRMAGHAVHLCAGLAEAGEADVIVLANPNNPDGRLVEPAPLLAVAARLHASGGLLVVDEAFVDASPARSVAGCPTPGLLVLRSFGKFFGLAGLRLGFAVADRRLADQLRDALGPWPVSGPALAIGLHAMEDQRWIEATRERLIAESARLARLLGSTGHAVRGGTAYFQLVETDLGADLYAHLGRRGILVRAFAAAPHRLRFGLPKSDDEWARLQAALAAWRL